VTHLSKTLTLYGELPNSLRHKYVMFVHSLLYSLLSLCSSQYMSWKGMAYNELLSRLSCLTCSLFSLQMTTFAELSQLKVKFPTVVPAILWIISKQHLSITVNVLAAAGDVIIAIVLCYMLQKSRTGFKKSVVFVFFSLFAHLAVVSAFRSDTMITKLVILRRSVA